jgi:glycosyltransferase involved in cell wall biosynthesis
MASGIPAVASRCAGASELITHGRDSMIIDDPRDPDEIAAHMRHVIDNNLLEQMGKAARKTAERYTWNYKRVYEVYEEALRR